MADPLLGPDAADALMALAASGPGCGDAVLKYEAQFAVASPEYARAHPGDWCLRAPPPTSDVAAMAGFRALPWDTLVWRPVPAAAGGGPTTATVAVAAPSSRPSSVLNTAVRQPSMSANDGRSCGSRRRQLAMRSLNRGCAVPGRWGKAGLGCCSPAVVHM